jgi:hypothetical protein
MSAVVAIAMVAVTQQEFSLSHTLLLCSCSIITSSIASLLLGNIGGPHIFSYCSVCARSKVGTICLKVHVVYWTA